MRYERYHLYLDMFGVLGIILALACYRYGHSFDFYPGAGVKDDELVGLWSNLSAGVIDIWLSVRIIDIIIRRNEKHHSFRLGFVRNSRWLFNQIHRAIEFAGRFELDVLKYEVEFSKKRLVKRKRYLSVDETVDLTNYYSEIERLYPELEQLVACRGDKFGDDETKTSYAKLQDLMYGKLSYIRTSQRKAEENILVETDEE